VILSEYILDILRTGRERAEVAKKKRALAKIIERITSIRKGGKAQGLEIDTLLHEADGKVGSPASPALPLV